MYLGHIVGNGGVEPDPAKVQVVRDFPVPTSKIQVRALLGLTRYYRRFIPNYANLAVVLTDLTKKSAPSRIQWTEACGRAFKELKHMLCSSPVLRSPDFDKEFDKEFVLQTDASERGVGAVLSQKDHNGEEHPIAYYSKKLQPREERYSTVENECLATKLAMFAFRTYLLGSPFTVQTDHRSLMWMDKLKDSNTRLMRWSLSLQPFMFKVVHRTGKSNGNADCLSRTPWPTSAANEFVAGEEGRSVMDWEPDDGHRRTEVLMMDSFSVPANLPFEPELHRGSLYDGVPQPHFVMVQHKMN